MQINRLLINAMLHETDVFSRYLDNDERSDAELLDYLNSVNAYNAYCFKLVQDHPMVCSIPRSRKKKK